MRAGRRLRGPGHYARRHRRAARHLVDGRPHADAARRRPGPPRPALGLRQDRDRRLRARPGRARRRARLDRRHRRASSQAAGLDVRPIEDFTGFPEIMDGRVKTLHPKLHAGLLAVRSDPAHLAAGGRARRRVRRPRLREPLPVRAHRRARRDAAPEEVIEKIDVGGPTMIRAAAKNHAYTAVVASPGGLRRRARGAADGRRPPVDGDAPVARGRGVLLHRALRHGDLALVRRAARRTSRASTSAPTSSVARPALRREPAPARRLLRAGRRAAARALARAPAPRQGSSRTTTSSTSTPRAALARDLGERPACVIVKHNNPCGAALGERRARRLPARLRLRPGQRLRRHHRAQPPGRPRDRRGALRAVRRGPAARPATRTTRSRSSRASRTCGILEDEERRRPRPARARRSARSTGGLLVQDRDRAVARPRRRWRSPPSAHPTEAGVARPALRLARSART